MRRIDINSVILTDFPMENKTYIADWAGFPPFVRGNSVRFAFPKLVSKTDFKEVVNQNKINYLFDNKQVTKISSLENFSELHQIFSENTSEEKLFLLSSHINFTLETIAFVRALRAVNSLFSAEKTIKIGVELTFLSLENLPFIIASMPEFLVCDEEIKRYIVENEEFMNPNTIDPFGGNPLLEEKTNFFITEILK